MNESAAKAVPCGHEYEAHYKPVWAGIPLFLTPGKQTPNSPSLDRVDSSRGYEPGNVQVISNRANAMKHDATFEEFEMMYLNWKKQRAAS